MLDVASTYRKYGALVFSRCRRVLRDDALAEDATQEVFIRLMRHAPALPDDTTALRAWLARVATNYSLNLVRNRGTQAQPTGDAELLTQLEESLEAQLTDRQWVQQVLRRMPTHLREPARLYFLEELEQQQVGDALGLTRRTIHTRLQDFLTRAREAMASGVH